MAADEYKVADVGVQVSMPAGEHIARHRNRANPKPQAPTRVTLAFGNLAQPVLVEKMGSEDDEIVRNALAAVVRLFKVPLNVVKSVAAGGVATLTRLTQHADTEIRRRAAKALELIMHNSSGRRAVCGDRKCLPALAAVMDDNDVQVRLNLASGLVALSSKVEGAEALVECGYVKLLVRKAGKDAEVEVQKRSLVVLNKCTNVIGGRGLSDSLAHGAVRCCIGLLGHRDADVRHLAAFALASLAFAPEGKVQAIKGGGVPVLLKLMTDRHEDVRASAAAAIMGIVTDDSGKVAVIEAGISSLVACLQDSNVLVALNTLKAVATVAAHPKARVMLNEANVVPLMEAIVEDGPGTLHKSARTAMAAVLWKP